MNKYEEREVYIRMRRAVLYALCFEPDVALRRRRPIEILAEDARLDSLQCHCAAGCVGGAGHPC